MNTIKITMIFTLFFLPLLAIGQSDEVNIPFDNDTSPKYLSVNVFRGNITVVGIDRKDISVIYQRTSREESNGQNATAKNGMKVISGSSADVEMGSSDNRAYVRTHNPRSSIDVTIEVPKDVALNIGKESEGEISITGMTSNINIESGLGGVDVQSFSGTISASSNQGPITIDFVGVPGDKNMMITNAGGDIDITLPEEYNASLKMKTMMGQVYSDLDLSIRDEPRESKIKKDDNGGTFKYSSGGWTYADLNNGGVEVTINTYQGNIFLRKRE